METLAQQNHTLKEHINNELHSKPKLLPLEWALSQVNVWDKDEDIYFLNEEFYRKDTYSNFTSQEGSVNPKEMSKSLKLQDIYDLPNCLIAFPQLKVNAKVDLVRYYDRRK